MAYLTPDTPINQVQATIILPDTIMPLMVGALSDLSLWWQWEEFGSLTVDQTIAYINAMLATIAEQRYIPGYKNAVQQNIFALHASSGTLSMAQYPTSRTQMLTYTVNGANTDYVEYSIPLGWGLWQVDLYTVQTTSAGILSITLDGNVIGTYDAYKSGSTVYNTLVSMPNIRVAASGNKLLRFRCPTKNASSSAYRLYLTDLILTRTGD